MLAVEEVERATDDEHRPQLEVVDVVPRLRARLPVREVVYERRAGRIDLEEEVRLHDVDAADVDPASPERVDAAGDDDLPDGGEVRVYGAGRVGDAQVVEDDPGMLAGHDLDAVNGDLALQFRLERLLHAQLDEVREARRAEVPPAAADDEGEEGEAHEERDAHTPHEGPHGTAALTLARRLMVVPFRGVLSRFHSDALETC